MSRCRILGSGYVCLSSGAVRCDACQFEVSVLYRGGFDTILAAFDPEIVHVSLCIPIMEYITGDGRLSPFRGWDPQLFVPSHDAYHRLP
jgi:hypothetical protein